MNKPTLPSSRDILVVDDDIFVVKSLERMLRPFCNHVFTAISGEHALAILQRHTVVAVVADILCPPISGIDVFRTAKLAHAATFTLMLSGKNDIRDIRRAMRDGIVDGFLSKPWDNKDVIAALHDSLAHHHADCYDNCCAKNSLCVRQVDAAQPPEQAVRTLCRRLCATKAQRGENSSEQLCCMRDEGWPLGVGV